MDGSWRAVLGTEQVLGVYLLKEWWCFGFEMGSGYLCHLLWIPPLCFFIILIFKKFFIGGKLAPTFADLFHLHFPFPSDFLSIFFCTFRSQFKCYFFQKLSLTSQTKIGSPAPCSCHMVVPSHRFIPLFVTISFPHKIKLWEGIKPTLLSLCALLYSKHYAKDIIGAQHICVEWVKE